MNDFASRPTLVPLTATTDFSLESVDSGVEASANASSVNRGLGEAATQTSQGVAYLFDHDLRYLSSEGKWSGLELDEQVIGKSLWEVFPPEVCQQLKPLHQCALGGQVVIQEIAYNRQTYQVQTIPVRNEQGKLFAGMMCIQNITDRKKAEIALRQSEEFKQRLLESSNDCLKVLDLEGRLLYMNLKGRCQMEIDDFESICNAEWVSFWQGDNRLEAEAAVAAAKAGRTKRFQGYCSTAKGTPKWWDVVVSPMQDVDGNVVQILSVSRDITAYKHAEDERKQAEVALQEQIEHTQFLYETTRDLLSTTQPLTLIKTVFNRLKALLGLDFYVNYITDERLRLHLKLYGGISSQVARSIECLEAGQPICGLAAQQQCQIVRMDVQQAEDLKTSWLRSLGATAYACQPLIAQGRLFGTLGFGSRTRTYFTTLEKNLFQAICDQIAIALERSELLASVQKQAEDLMQANRTKDDFLAVLSHELRTPLSSILGWAHLLQLQHVSSEKRQRGVAIIEQSARQQAQLIEDLLDIARITRGKLSLDFCRVDLTTPVTAAVETVRLAADAKSIKVKVELDPKVGHVRGDAGRLRQVLCNLLSNALKFTPAGGQIELKLERFTLDPTPDSPYAQNFAQITVSDTGRGIDPDFLPYVFELFRQQDGSTTRHFGGLGLGLAIAHQVVKAHQGSISVASAGEGQGTTFTVRLPLATPSKPELSSATPFQCHNLRDLRVLVVDDDAAVLEVVEAFLEQEGIFVQTASSAVEALEALSQSPFDVLISDIGMPHMDGYTLIQQVRTLPHFNREIPALALTAYASEPDQYQALAAGFQAHLAKPFEPQYLLAEVAALAAQ